MNFTTISSIPTLRIIFLTQFLWGLAYFSFITVLADFLEKTMGMPQPEILILLWSFYITGLVFACFIGLTQDYWLGIKRSLYLGVTLAFLGYLSMFVLEYLYPSYILLFFILSIIAVGKSFVSNSIYAMLGKVYPPSLEDTAIERFITIDYIVSNIGALVGTFIAGIFLFTLSEHITLFIPLGVSAFSLFCLIIFGVFLKKINSDPDLKALSSKDFLLTVLVLCITISLGWLCLNSVNNIYPILLFCVVFSIVFLVFQYIRGNILLRSRLLFVALVLVQLFVYYFFYHQGFNLVNIYTQRVIPTTIFFGFEIKPQFYNIFNYFWVVFAGGVLLLLHKKLEMKNIRLSIFYQSSLAILLSLVAFLLLYISTFFIGSSGFISLWWIFIFYFLQSTAEIIIAYVGISLFIKLMPSHLISFGLGVRTTILTLPALILSIPGKVDALHLEAPDIKQFFQSEFLTLLIIGVILCIPIILLQPFIKWLYLKKSSFLIDNEINKEFRK